MIPIEEMENMLDRIAEELPPEFYSKLNGGIILETEAKLHSQDKAGNLFIMGEYFRDAYLGRYIAIYYGSFSKVYGNLSENEIEARLREVLRHEFRHHLESLAGEDGLEKEDERDISAYLARMDNENRP